MLVPGELQWKGLGATSHPLQWWRVRCRPPSPASSCTCTPSCALSRAAAQAQLASTSPAKAIMMQQPAGTSPARWVRLGAVVSRSLHVTLLPLRPKLCSPGHLLAHGTMRPDMAATQAGA